MGFKSCGAHSPALAMTLAGFIANQTDLILFTSADSLPPDITRRKIIPPEQRQAYSQPQTPLLEADSASASVSQGFLQLFPPGAELLGRC